MANLYKQINSLDTPIQAKEDEIKYLLGNGRGEQWEIDNSKNELIDLLLLQRTIFKKIIGGNNEL
jgi:hypothetical protein